MNALSKFRNSEAFHMMLGVGAVLVLGFGTATAAISVGPKDDVNPAMRPLASGPSIQLNAAYGADDEDCAWVTHKVTVNGKTHIVRKFECAQ